MTSLDFKEVKIGNKLLFLGEEITVEGITNLPKRPDMYWIKPIGMIESKIFHFEPITLTEEWLLRFGFEKSRNGYFTKFAGSNVMSVYCFDNFSRIEIVTQSICSIKYVHQLQNLFSALTGEEL